MSVVRYATTCLVCLLLAFPAAALERMDDSDLDEVKAQSGIAIALSDVRIYKHKSDIAYRDTERHGNSMVFENIVFSNGNQGPMRFNTPQPVTLRMLSNSERPIVAIEAPHWQQEVAIDVHNFVFCEQSLGSLHLSGFSPSEFALYASPLNNIRGGIGFQLEAKAQVDELRWQYNRSSGEGDAAYIRGFHMAGSFVHEGDVPEDPSTWQAQDRFAIGDLNPYGESQFLPAEFSMGGNPGRAYIELRMPMEGSVRMEEIRMGSHDMGPIIIDGMRVHELTVEFVAAGRAPPP